MWWQQGQCHVTCPLRVGSGRVHAAHPLACLLGPDGRQPGLDLVCGNTCFTDHLLDSAYFSANWGPWKLRERMGFGPFFASGALAT